MSQQEQEARCWQYQQTGLHCRLHRLRGPHQPHLLYCALGANLVQVLTGLCALLRTLLPPLLLRRLHKHRHPCHRPCGLQRSCSAAAPAAHRLPAVPALPGPTHPQLFVTMCSAAGGRSIKCCIVLKQPLYGAGMPGNTRERPSGMLSSTMGLSALVKGTSTM